MTTLVTDKGAYDVDMVCVELCLNCAILFDRQLQSSVRDVYGLGDCATFFYNALDGEPGYIALASNAVRSGIVAGHNICGTPLETPGVQGSSGICIYDLKMVSTGVTESAAKRAGLDVKTTTVTFVTS